MADELAWLESLSPWPEEFGLERMRALLADLGDPQRRFPSVHVVGTNGKSTATRTIEALLEREGLRVGAYLSPHVRAWSERIRVEGAEAGLDEALARVRRPAERVGATQFEVLTAAALAAFAEVQVDVAVVEAGLGGRLDATNVVDAPVVLLTNVALEHTEVLGDTPEEIATEKLAVAHAARVVVMPDDVFAHLVPTGARTVVGGAREAAAAFLGRDPGPAPAPALPGRLEWRGRDLFDGAHNPAGVEWLVERAGRRFDAAVVSILADKDADAMLAGVARLTDTLVATRSTSPRALPAVALAARARARFARVSAVEEPETALGRARELAGPEGSVLVTGSLYLLADLAREELRVR